MKIFCDRLKETRGSASQKAFAAIIGLNQQTYQRYETGVREPDLEHLHRIGVTLGVSIDWLLGLPDRGGTATTITGNTGAVAIGPHANAKCTTLSDTSPHCETCKFKKFAEAFKAIQSAP